MLAMQDVHWHTSCNGALGRRGLEGTPAQSRHTLRAPITKVHNDDIAVPHRIRQLVYAKHYPKLDRAEVERNDRLQRTLNLQSKGT